jgi:hypothetical protein
MSAIEKLACYRELALFQQKAHLFALEQALFVAQ